ncbi:hypothetical protein AS156_22995 [Bradyrhizobium macuxiense]|uniref:Uncharacterized protein n=1 Tax=Bradyrhizobium macuxiense TaxID=1755647 RepID=A0A109JBN5_9BRAD|nr:hypothetical protein [Bradyrhizobium macuxiense]KWV45886.1 hypothetical protein AS156_22995 [Bradyrhizobium macuxiense]
MLIDGFQARFSELSDAVVIIYVSLLQEPDGPEVSEKSPVVTQQSLIAGQKFGQSVHAATDHRGTAQEGHDL